MNGNRFGTLITSAWNLLEDYYLQSDSLNPLDFVQLTQQNSSRLLIDDSSDDETAFVAIEFPATLHSSICANGEINPAELSLICEELSHFYHYSQAASRQTKISVFELETLAEIDRFICFMHWNDFFPQLKMNIQHENCLDLCALLFEKRNFEADNVQLYLDAESAALHHLKKAFAHCWSNRWIDTRRFDPRARLYFVQRLSDSRTQRLTRLSA